MLDFSNYRFEWGPLNSARGGPHQNVVERPEGKLNVQMVRRAVAEISKARTTVRAYLNFFVCLND